MSCSIFHCPRICEDIRCYELWKNDVAFHDARRLNAAVITADICIVGAGAAGISFAREFAGHPCRVALIESGDFEFHHRPQMLYLGENTGTANYSTARSRIRMFGGSTTRWGAQCRPLDPLDFAERNGIAHSGWPFTCDELEPHYRRAQRICNLGPYDYSLSAWRSADGGALQVDDARLETKIFQFSFPSDFGQIYRAELGSAPNIDIYLNANVVDIEVDEHARQVTGLCVATFNDRRIRFVATTYLLACGGIENARLLLASNRVASAGVGNQHDLVGRFFMDHPYFLLGYYQPARPQHDRSIYVIDDYEHVGSEQKANAALSLSESTLREEELNACAVYFVRRPLYKTLPEYFSPSAKSFIHLIDVLRHHELPDRRLGRHVHNIVSGFSDVGRSLGRQIVHTVRPRSTLALRAVLETTPNPDSRVTLGARKDRFGMPRVQVDWRLNDRDKRGLERLMEIMRAEFARLKLGSLIEDHAQDSSGWPNSMTGGKHHMGTTRMHADERKGVVDPNCRVHGCANLYIAGSSVFPTGGFANPTLTIVALAVRLADHIKSRLRSLAQ
jgi:choline dehydrogenase-like flavoprotein